MLNETGGGRGGGREGGRKEGREGGREGGKERGREGGREGEGNREEGEVERQRIEWKTRENRGAAYKSCLVPDNPVKFLFWAVRKKDKGSPQKSIHEQKYEQTMCVVA